jgi:O-acetyl-ADP-ribose deacetylase (regulator of RNase III)
MEEIKGNLLNSKTTYIAHQCNCKTNLSSGLAYSIFCKFPHADTYNKSYIKRIPGTISVHNNVINMYAQIYPGKSNYPNDTPELRLQYFKSCLHEISKLQGESIAFPYNIGCGLAGGNWQEYKQLISEFSKNTALKVYIVHL